jgi:hypothetical protein
MLYDPKWGKQRDVTFYGMTLSGFAAWLATMPPEGEYDYCDDRACALAQYRASLGRCRVAVRLPNYLGKSEPSPGHTFQNIVLSGEWTYGAALARARAVLAG